MICEVFQNRKSMIMMTLSLQTTRKGSVGQRALPVSTLQCIFQRICTGSICLHGLAQECSFEENLPVVPIYLALICIGK